MRKQRFTDLIYIQVCLFLPIDKDKWVVNGKNALGGYILAVYIYLYGSCDKNARLRTGYR